MGPIGCPEMSVHNYHCAPGLQLSFEARAGCVPAAWHAPLLQLNEVTCVRNLGGNKSRQRLGVEMWISRLTHTEATLSFTVYALTRIEKRTTNSTRTFQLRSSHLVSFIRRTESRRQEGSTPTSYLRLEVDYPDLSLSRFSSVPSGMCRYGARIRPQPLFSYVISSSSFVRPIIRRHILV